MLITNNCRSIAPRMFNMIDTFPITPPIVSFTGLVIGPGTTLLHEEACLGDTQLKCCGFIQLSSFLIPGNPSKPPFKGFHPFQVFIIFPIHANPWTVLYKKMMEKQETNFQPNTLFSCTGKVAGFLDHHIMVKSPLRTQDYVFIVVPDTWYIHDKPARDSISTPSSVTTPTKQPSMNPSNQANFMSPSTRPIQQARGPTTNTASFTGQTSHTESTNLITCY